jgi:hypothetical protein
MIEEAAEETLATGRAAVGGEAQNSLQPFQVAVERESAGNFLQRETAALRAVRVPDQRDGNVPAVKTILAGAATPGAQLRDADRVIRHAFTAGARAVRRITFGTNQSAPTLLN